MRREERPLLHKGIYMPPDVETIVFNYMRKLKNTNIEISQHIIDHINEEDKKHHYTMEEIKQVIKETCMNSSNQLFEVELDKNKREYGDYSWYITKWCIRVPFTKDFKDKSILALVLRPNKENNSFKLCTARINKVEDKHNTLRRENYWDFFKFDNYDNYRKVFKGIEIGQ